MPIRPENRARYPRDWKDISRRIRFERAESRCECMGHCGLHSARRCVEEHGKKAIYARGIVILTVAHLNHQPEDVGELNLLAMCQRCHLRYDARHHLETRTGQTYFEGAGW